jgi:DNA ligase-associated metallophosphoesterase
MIEAECDAVSTRREPGLRICGTALMPSRDGALWWAEQQMLIVADLHLEKASAFAKRGSLLPPYDTAETLKRLERLVEALNPRAVLALGDNVHDAEGAARMPEAMARKLSALQAGRDWIWILGNHDVRAHNELGGEWHEESRIGPLVFRHRPGVEGRGELAGHLHPCARVRGQGGTVRRRCFLADENRVVLPAFGALTGGLNVLDPAFDGLFEDDATHAWVLGRSRIYAVPSRRLVPEGV